MILIEDLQKIPTPQSAFRLSPTHLARLAISRLHLKRQKLLRAVPIIPKPKPVTTAGAELQLISVTVRGDRVNTELVERILAMRRGGIGREMNDD